MNKIKWLIITLLWFMNISYLTAQSDIEITDSISDNWGGGIGGGGLSPIIPTAPVTSLSLSKNSITIEGGERYRLTAQTNSTASNKRVTWSIEDNNIARVSSDGTVMGRKTGTTVVTATSVSNPEISASCTVTVTSDYVAPQTGWVLPWGKEEAWSMKYRYSELGSYTEPVNDAQGNNWKELDYDDSSWNTLTGPMGSEGIWYSTFNYVWTGEYNCYCLRRSFTLLTIGEGEYSFKMQHDDDIKVYLNGELVINEPDWTDERISTYTIPNEKFVEGENMLAIYIQQNWGGAFLDYGLYYEHKEEPSYILTYIIDGKVYATEEVKNGTTITPPAVKEKEGYTFAWGEYPTTMPAKDVTIEGGYSTNSYKLAYMVDGEEYKIVTLPYGTTITPEALPSKEGYTFSGWSEIPASMPAKDVTVTGTFSANSYKVTYMVDGEVYATETVVYGKAIPAKAYPTKAGYNFCGWGNVPATMPANDITLSGTFTVNKDLKYALIYMVDGVEYKRTTLSFMDAITLDEAPTKEGHTFSGWSEVPEVMPLHDVTVTGTFTVNSYTVTYMIDGTLFKTESVNYGATIKLPAVEEKEGHTFAWGEYPATMPAKDVTIEGSFTINSYTITYKVDGEVYATKWMEYGSTIVLKEAPTKEGYLFSGWSEAPETMPAHDIEIIGQFEVDGIEAVISDKVVNVYTLQGVMVKRQISIKNLEQELPAGIYIINGKKFVVK